MPDIVADRLEELNSLIVEIDSELATLRAKLSDLTSEAAIATGVQGVGNQGQQRIGQLLALRKEYVAERAALPLGQDINIIAGTDIYGDSLDES